MALHLAEAAFPYMALGAVAVVAEVVVVVGLGVVSYPEDLPNSFNTMCSIRACVHTNPIQYNSQKFSNVKSASPTYILQR